MKAYLIGFALLALASYANAQIYAYNVTVILGNNDFKKQEGKLLAIFKGGNGRYDHKIKLSTSNEGLWPRMTRSFYVTHPYPIEYVEKVAVGWDAKGIHVFNKPKIYVDSIILDPAYNPSPVTRRQMTRCYTSQKRPTSVTHDSYVEMWVRC